ncbi:calcitonin gene-related peptide type 1 receptor [Hoplias malabaricus]|uniref:calcitonin gene-related peptide type 1 receptor n=1 Tax=Hoplias malabaricus TaxID=27720 RepID=UPI003461CF09
MGKLQSFLLLLLSLLTTEVCQSEDMMPTTITSLAEVTNTPLYPTAGSESKLHILSAQFECYLKILHDPPYTGPGPYCNRTWDGWLCWEDTSPGVAIQQCPTYFNDFDPSEKVTKVCNPDGQWFLHPESNRWWTNYTLCNEYTRKKREIALTTYYLAVLGHTLSLVSLLISLFIFSYFKCLSCQRISLHKNMFLSFILNSVMTVTWLSMVTFHKQQINSNPIGCKILAFLVHYTSCSTYFWMLCEGIYLHTLIIVAVFVGEQQLGWYYLLGWGFPVIPAVIHAVARALYYDDMCWLTNTNLLYIIHCPILVALVVNLIFLLNIVRVLITKLSVTHKAESHVYMKAVRATLILVPLMGAHFILVPMQPEGRVHNAVYEFFMNLCVHFQGLLVAIIFCFANGEVQSTIRRKSAQYRAQWGRRLVTTDSHGNYHTNSSITESSRVIVTLETAPPYSENDKTHTAILSLNGQSNGKGCHSKGQGKPRESSEI